MAKPTPPDKPATDTVTVSMEELLAEVDVAELVRELEAVTVDELLAAVPTAEELSVLLESVEDEP